MQTHSEIKCDFCGKEFKSAVSLKNHILKTDDSQHQLLAFIYNELKFKCKELNSYVEKYRDFFDTVTKESLPVSERELLNKIKEDIQAEQKRKEEKKQQLKLQRHLSDLKRLQELEEERSIRKRLEKDMFDSLPEADKPVNIVNEFYNMIHDKCYNYTIEVKLIKALYTQKKFDAETIHFIVKYMAKTGCSNLRSINYKINDALNFRESMKLIKTENTIPYLIKYYYKSLHMKMNVKTFMKELNKIKSSMLANNLTMQQVKNVLDGMISQNKRVLSWFDSYVSQYADKNVKENPIHVCTENREVDMNVHEILRGKMTLDKVSDRIKNQCIDKLKNVFMQGSFDNRYNYFEWAYKINLPLTKDMVTFANQHNNERNNRFQKWYESICLKHDDGLMVKYNNTMKNYNLWLEKQQKL